MTRPARYDPFSGGQLLRSLRFEHTPNPFLQTHQCGARSRTSPGPVIAEGDASFVGCNQRRMDIVLAANRAGVAESPGDDVERPENIVLLLSLGSRRPDLTQC